MKEGAPSIERKKWCVSFNWIFVVVLLLSILFFFLSNELWYKYPYPFFSILMFSPSLLVCECVEIKGRKITRCISVRSHMGNCGLSDSFVRWYSTISVTSRIKIPTGTRGEKNHCQWRLKQGSERTAGMIDLWKKEKTTRGRESGCPLRFAQIDRSGYEQQKKDQRGEEERAHFLIHLRTL